MKLALGRWIAALDLFADAGNPLTVRLLRQQARSLTLAIVLHLLLLGGVVATVAAATIAPEHLLGSRMALLRSEILFLLVVTLWSAAAWIVQPVMFIATVRQEREETTWDLLDLTGLPPLRVLSGLVGAAAIQQFLLLAMMAPFLVMAWMLNGVDPLVILLTAVIVPLNGVMSVCIGIKATVTGKRGSLAGRPGRAAIGASLAWLLVMYLLWMFTISRGFIPGFPSLRALGEGPALGALLLCNLALQVGAGALVDAAMRLTHPAGNRCTAPRVLTIAFLANLLLVMLGLLLLGVTDWLEALAWTALIAAGWNTFSSIDVFAEPFSLTRRQSQDCAAPSSLRRFLDPGAAAARKFHLLIALPAMGAGIIAWIFGYGDLPGSVGAMAVGACCYGALLLMICDAIARGGDHSVSRPVRHRRWVWGFVIIGTLGGGFLSGVTGGSAVIASLSPLFGLIPFAMAGAGSFHQDAPAAVVLVSCAGIFALVAMASQANHQPEIRPVRGEPT
ncbi:MAG: hypothetical protein H0W78_19765 [Planctomycetes bacterium]|nr:hypothetical protein [Planctomycetota bacterium]